jgi:hypothetical protein
MVACGVDLAVIGILVQVEVMPGDNLIELGRVHDEQQWPQDGTLRNAEVYRSRRRQLTVVRDLLGAVRQE